MYLVALYKIISPHDNKIISITSRQRSKMTSALFRMYRMQFCHSTLLYFPAIFTFFVLNNRLILNLEVF